MYVCTHVCIRVCISVCALCVHMCVLVHVLCAVADTGGGVPGVGTPPSKLNMNIINV